MSKLAVMFDCPDYGPDASHYYADENTGEYSPVCSCGHHDPFMPRDNDAWPGLVLTSPVNPPF